MYKYKEFRSEMRARKTRHTIEKIKRGIYYGAGAGALLAVSWVFIVLYMLTFID